MKNQGFIFILVALFTTLALTGVARADAGEGNPHPGLFQSEAGRAPKYRSICHLIGKPIEVTVQTLTGELITKTVVIGDKNDRCPGRCGPGCNEFPSALQGGAVYAWECLEHDICERAKNDWFGVCTLLLLKAKHAMKSAPNCD